MQPELPWYLATEEKNYDGLHIVTERKYFVGVVAVRSLWVNYVLLDLLFFDNETVRYWDALEAAEDYGDRAKLGGFRRLKARGLIETVPKGRRSFTGSQVDAA